MTREIPKRYWFKEPPTKKQVFDTEDLAGAAFDKVERSLTFLAGADRIDVKTMDRILDEVREAIRKGQIAEVTLREYYYDQESRSDDGQSQDDDRAVQSD